MLRTSIALCGGALLLAIVAAAPVRAAELPLRKPGLWTMKNAKMGKEGQHCTDATVDKKMMKFTTADFLPCSKQELQKTPNGYVLTRECTAMGQTATTKIEFIGDFDSAFKMRTTTSGAPDMGEIEFKWAGTCKSGQKPGDIVSEIGTINVSDMPN